MIDSTHICATCANWNGRNPPTATTKPYCVVLIEEGDKSRMFSSPQEGSGTCGKWVVADYPGGE